MDNNNNIVLPFVDSQEEMDKLAIETLLANGFEVTPDNTALFGSAIQQLASQSKDLVETEVVTFIRRMRTLKFSYYLIHPDKRTKPEADNGSEAETATNAVVQEA